MMSILPLGLCLRSVDATSPKEFREKLLGAVESRERKLSDWLSCGDLAASYDGAY